MSITDELTSLLVDVIEKKPNTRAEAMAIIEKLEVKLTMWLISELPAVEQKAVVATKWAVAEVRAGKCCF